MKKYKAEMLKLIVIAFVTPLLVMFYTVIEKAVAGASTDKAVQIQVTPVLPAKKENNKTAANGDYILAKNK